MARLARRRPRILANAASRLLRLAKADAGTQAMTDPMSNSIRPSRRPISGISLQPGQIVVLVDAREVPVALTLTAIAQNAAPLAA